MSFYVLTHEEIGGLLADLSDIRAALSEEVLNQLKDSEGTELTIGDLLDDQLEFLRNLEQTK